MDKEVLIPSGPEGQSTGPDTGDVSLVTLAILFMLSLARPD